MVVKNGRVEKITSNFQWHCLAGIENQVGMENYEFHSEHVEFAMLFRY